LAQTFCLKVNDIERIEHMMALAEARRNATLREIDRHRQTLGQKLRRGPQQLEDGQFRVIEDTTSNDGGNVVWIARAKENQIARMRDQARARRLLRAGAARRKMRSATGSACLLIPIPRSRKKLPHSRGKLLERTPPRKCKRWHAISPKPRSIYAASAFCAMTSSRARLVIQIMTPGRTGTKS